jgi:putative ABC transport system permease protein
VQAHHLRTANRAAAGAAGRWDGCVEMEGGERGAVVSRSRHAPTATVISINAVLIALFLPVYGLVAVLAVRRPLLRRLALRESLARPWQSILLVAGLTVSASMILTAQITGDSIADSLTSAAYRSWGRVDVTVSSTGAFDRGVAERLASDPDVRRSFAGVQAGVELSGSVVDLDRQLGKPGVRLIGFDPSSQSSFGAYVLTDGRRTYGQELAGQQVLISSSLAESLRAAKGDHLRLTPGTAGRRTDVSVAGVARAAGPGAYGLRPSIFAPLNTMRILTGSDDVNIVRLTGHGEGQAELETAHRGLPAVQTALRAASARGPSLHVSEAKAADVRALRQLSDDNLPTTFLVALTVVAASIAVVVTLALALAAERRPGLAVLRALGLSRAGLVIAALIEGGIYTGIAAVTAILPGVVGGWFMVSHSANVIDPIQGTDASLRVVVTPFSVLAAAAGASLVALLTILLAAIHTSQMAISSAVKDLPEQETSGGRRRVRVAVMALLGLLSAGLLLTAGVTARVLGGIGLVLLASMAVRGRIPIRLRSTVAGAAVAIWVLGAAVAVDAETLRSSASNLYFVIATAAVGGMSLVVAHNLRLLERLVGLAGWALGLGTALAPTLVYLTRRPVRATLSTGALALLLAGLAAFAVFFGTIRPDYRRDSGGYDLRVISTGSPTFALPSSLDSRVERTLVIPTRTYVGSYRSSTSLSGPPLDWHQGHLTLYEFTDDLLAHPPLPLTSRDPRFSNDAEVWRALKMDPRLVLTGPFGTGSHITLIGASGPVELRVAGSYRPGVFAGLIGSSRALSQFGVSAPGITTLLKSRPGVDAVTLAVDLRHSLLNEGVDVITTRELLDDGLAPLRDFMFEQEFLLRLSLLVGVCSLGILGLRAVFERRRAIGVLRALGYQSRALLAGLILEAFLATTAGVVVGLAVGLTIGCLIMRVLFPTAPLGVEVSSLVAVVVLVYSTVLVVTIGPAIRASRLPVAECLRLVG